MDTQRLVESRLNKTFIMGDEHWNHNAVFIYEPRGFQAPEDMWCACINNWKAVHTVRGEDPESLYIHLGDSIMGTQDLLPRVARQFSSYGTHLFCRGNHMSDKKRHQLEDEYGWIYIGEEFTFRYRGREIVLSHYPLDIARVNSHRSEKPEDGRMPMINIHAHTHSRNFHTAPYQICVSADALDCVPFNLKDAIKAALQNI